VVQEDVSENCFARYNNTDTYSFGICETKILRDGDGKSFNKTLTN
jgi:hypothetical protein